MVGIGGMLSGGCVVHLPWPLHAFGHSAIAVEARPAASSKYLDIVNEFLINKRNDQNRLFEISWICQI